jgi:hypothetical protein
MEQWTVDLAAMRHRSAVNEPRDITLPKRLPSTASNLTIQQKG